MHSGGSRFDPCILHQTRRIHICRMRKNDCIIAIGCSHTFGCEHRSTENDTIPSKETFIDHLGEKLDLPVYNFSQNGAANQTILRRLMIALEFTQTKKLNPLFILQWTELERYETLVPGTVYSAADWPWIRTNAEIKSKSKKGNLKKWSEDFYRLYESKTLLFESLKSVQHANLELQSLGHPVINCLAEGWNLDGLHLSEHPGFVSSDNVSEKSVYSETLRTWYKENNYVLDKALQDEYKIEAYRNPEAHPSNDDIVLSLLWKQITKHNWWFYNRDWKYGLKDYCKDNDLEIGSEGHALESAHRHVFRYIDQNDQFLNTLTQ